MRKFGILTTNRAINYGAVLQCYALSKKIDSFENVECEVVDYAPPKKTYGRTISYKFKSIKDIAYSTILFLNKKYRSGHIQKIKGFDNFITNILKQSKKTYIDINDFGEELKDYEALVCGSDQIWNLNIIDDPVFFLQFDKVPNNPKKVAYAPSITEPMSDEQVEKIKDRTKDFSALSMRERESAELFTKHIGKEVKNVLDPVFLLNEEEWLKIAVKPKNVEKPFILSYGLVSDPLFKDCVSSLKSKYKGVKHVDLQVRPFNKYNADICTNEFSPTNFVWLFKNAEYTCTSSFHGTCFSIIFNKNFMSVPAKDRSLRIENILEIVNLEERHILDNEGLDKALTTEPDFNQSNILLKKNKEDSLNYLKKALAIETE
jgi:hypothetical protein